MDGKGDDIKILDEGIGSTHHFIDARDSRGSNIECGGPGLTSKEQCEYDNMVRQVILPLGITAPIVGVSIFFVWRKRK